MTNVGTVVALHPKNVRPWWWTLWCKPLTNCLLGPISDPNGINWFFLTQQREKLTSNEGTVVTLFENIRAWWVPLCCKPLTNCLLRPTSVTYEINLILVLFDPTETEISHQCGYCFTRHGYRSCSLLTTCAVRFRSSNYISNRILFHWSLLNGWQLG